MPQRSELSRRRPLACDPCRKRKLRCDRHMPCSMCLRSRKEQCCYEYSQQPRVPRSGPPDASTTAGYSRVEPADETIRVLPNQGGTFASPSTSASTGTQESADSLGEGRLAAGTWHCAGIGSVFVSGVSDDSSKPDSSDSGHGGFASAVYSSSRPSQPLEPIDLQTNRSRALVGYRRPTMSPKAALGGIATPIKGILVKGRFLGQSHWVQALTLVPAALNWVQKVHSREEPQLHAAMQSLKVISRQLKAQRRPKVWTDDVGKNWPNRAIANRLLELYIEGFEPIYRIMHVPTLMEEFAAYWQAPAAMDPLAILRLQICMALGCCLYDDALSLQSLAEQWMNEAKGWLVFCEKQKSDIGNLQLMCLLELCRRYYTKPSKFKSIDWISAGTLSQASFSMGMHMDPSKLPDVPRMEAEMRRRLWRAIIELQFDASLEASILPPTDPNDHGCELPSNLDDCQLTNGTSARPVDTFTDTSIQLALARSASIRLKVIKVGNDMQKQATYEEILQLHAELEVQHRELTTTLASYGTKVTPLQKELCDILLRRYFLVLHIPYAHLALNNNPLYHFSRTTCLDHALTVAYATLPALDDNPMLEALRTVVGAGPPSAEILRFTYCSNGPLRTAQGQAICMLSAELLSKVQDEAAHALQGDLVRTADEMPRAPKTLQSLQMHVLIKMALRTSEWRLRVVLTTPKDYEFLTLCLAEVEAAMEGAQRDVFVRTRLMECFETRRRALQEALDKNEEAMMGNFDPTSIGSSWLDDWHNFNWEDLAHVVPS